MDKRLLVKIIIVTSVSALLIGGIVAGIVLSRSRSPKKCVDGKSWSTTGREPCTSCSTSCPTNKIVDKKCTTTSDTTCKCEQGWEGIGCTGCISGSKACGPNGTCQEDGHCKCDERWTGIKCDQCDRSTCVEGQCNPKPTSGSPYCTCNPGWTGLKCDQCTSDKGCIHGKCIKGTCSCHPGWEKSPSQDPSGPCDTCIDEGTSNNAACNLVGICQNGKCKCPVDKNGEPLGWSGPECKVNKDKKVSFPCIYGGTLENSDSSKGVGDPKPCNTAVPQCPYGGNNEGYFPKDKKVHCKLGKCTGGILDGCKQPECPAGAVCWIYHDDGTSWRYYFGPTVYDDLTTPLTKCHNKDSGGGGWHCNTSQTSQILPCDRIWLQEGESCWSSYYNVLPRYIPGKLGGECSDKGDCESGLECVSTTIGSLHGICKNKT